MNEERMLKPAVIGGVLLGILSALPFIAFFNCFCCAWVIGGGVLASYMYVKDSPIPVTLGRGVALGLLTGVIGAIVSALFSIPLFLIANRAGRGLSQLRQALEQLPNVPPETLDRLRALSERGGIDVFFIAIGFVFMLVIYSLVAMLGGAIGVAVFEKRKPAAGRPPEIPSYEPPQTPPPPPPPDAPSSSS
jgi:hypothetical protein